MHEEQRPIQEAESHKKISKKDFVKRLSNWVGKGLTSLNQWLQLTALMDQYHQGNITFDAVVKEGAELTTVIDEKQLKHGILKKKEEKLHTNTDSIFTTVNQQEKNDPYVNSDQKLPTELLGTDDSYDLTVFDNVVLPEYDEVEPEDTYKKILDAKWVRPSYEQLNQEVEKVQIPNTAEKLTETAYSLLFISNDTRVIYRQIKWYELEPGKVYADGISENLRNQIKHKLIVGEKDTVGLTPLIIEYDTEGTIAMEFVEGVSLTQFEGTVPLETAKKFLDDVHNFHQLGLYHGDIQTDHIIIQPNGTLRLIDPNYHEHAEDVEILRTLQERDYLAARIFIRRYLKDEDKLKI